MLNINGKRMNNSLKKLLRKLKIDFFKDFKTKELFKMPKILSMILKANSMLGEACKRELQSNL
jgi:hypothetical protein